MLVAHQTDALVHSRTTPASVAPKSPTAVTIGSATANAVTFDVHANLSSVEALWRSFQQDADCTAFQAFDWHAAWQKHIGDPAGVRPAIVVVRSDARVIAIFPFAVEPGRLVSRLKWHASDLCDYNAPLLARDFATLPPASDFYPFFVSMLTTAQAQAGLYFDAAELTKMPERVGAQPNPFMQIPSTLNPNGAYATALFAPWDAFYAEKRSSATRRRDRTKRKRLGELGEVRFVTADTPAETAGTLATLMAQKARSFEKAGVPDIFQKPGYRAFYLDVATRPSTRHFVHVSRLDVGSTPAAVNLGLIFGGAYYHVLASYDDGEASRFGPGGAHLHDLMRYALDHDCTVFDFTIGDERYKREWSDGVLTLHDHRCATSLKGKLAMLPSTVVARAKRVVKQNPALWNLAQKLRARLGALRRSEVAAPDSDKADATE